MSFSTVNEVLLYLTIACCGLLLGIVIDILKDERAKKNKKTGKKPLDSDNGECILYLTEHNKHNEEVTMEDDEVERVQKELRRVFRGFELVIALLIVCAAVALCFALYYSL